MIQAREKKPEVVKTAEKVAKKEGGELATSQPITVPLVAEGQVMVPADFKSNFSRKQIEVIKEQFAKGASDMELQMFIYVCRMTKLDPFSKQIHLVPRYDSRSGKDIRVVQVGIDGLRSIAERTGAYAGNSDPEFGEEIEIEVKKDKWVDGKKSGAESKKYTVPSKATVTVKKVVQGVICDFTATAKWEEYYPGDKQGMMWIRMPQNMLGKCAEAKALRKAFPAVMSGLYVGEEMQQATTATVGAAAPEQVQGMFEKAAGMISQIKDPVGLGELKEKLEGSKKYTPAEKKKLIALVDARLKEIAPVEEKPEAK